MSSMAGADQAATHPEGARARSPRFVNAAVFVLSWLLALAALAGIAGWEARRRTRDFTIGERAAGRFA